MRKLILIMLAFTCFLQASQDFLDKHEQLILVTVVDWDEVRGICQVFEKKFNTWVARSEVFDVVIGRNGLAWGLGLHETDCLEGPIKKEGDGKAVAGAFTFSSFWGNASPLQMTHLKMPYFQISSTIEGVDDGKSIYFNQIVDRSKIEKIDWDSSEKFIDYRDNVYSYMALIDHNQQRVPINGSCIYMHVWEGPSIGTAGCTAMSVENMKKMFTFLDLTKRPVMVQLPKKEYLKLQKDWKLPDFTQFTE